MLLRSDTCKDSILENDPCICGQIRKILSSKLGVPETDITSGTQFVKYLGADSLDTVERIMVRGKTNSASRYPIGTRRR